MKLYIDQQTGHIYQEHDGDLWAHPIPANSRVINLDTEDMEWACVDGFGDTIEYDGKEITQLEFAQIIHSKLA